MDQRPAMDPALQAFLTAFAAAIGKDNMRSALETVSTGLMTSPVELDGIVRNLHAQGKIPDLVAARKALAAYLTISTNDATSTPTAEKPAKAEKPARAEKPAKAERPAKAASTPAPTNGADISDVKPATLSIDGTESAAAGWRAVLIGLTEATIDAGKITDIPKSFFRDGPSQPRSLEKQIKGGQWLYTNIDKAEQVKRVRTLIGILGQTVVVKTADGSEIAV